MIEFREDTHEYFLDGNKLISVTQLMRKHGLAPSYDNVPDEVLRAKAERGTLIHKEIEDYIKYGHIGFTAEVMEFGAHLTASGLKVSASEEKVYNDIVAGTVDLVLNNEIIADIKTTATLHKDAVSWQLSIYAYLYSLVHGTMLNRGQAYHFDKNGALNVVEIPLKPIEEVKKLFECERNGVVYNMTLTVSDTRLDQLVEIERLISTIEEQKKVAEAQAVELRAAIMQAMESNGILSYENDSIQLSYIMPYTKKAIDSARLKKELPDIADEYSKTSQVKASLRIKLKEI